METRGRNASSNGHESGDRRGFGQEETSLVACRNREVGGRQYCHSSDKAPHWTSVTVSYWNSSKRCPNRPPPQVPKSPENREASNWAWFLHPVQWCSPTVWMACNKPTPSGRSGTCS